MPLNPELPETKRDKVEAVVTTHVELVASVGLALALAVAFTLMGTSPVALGIFLGLAVALAVGAVR